MSIKNIGNKMIKCNNSGVISTTNLVPFQGSALDRKTQKEILAASIKKIKEFNNDEKIKVQISNEELGNEGLSSDNEFDKNEKIIIKEKRGRKPKVRQNNE